jgi:hypothetical protein
MADDAQQRWPKFVSALADSEVDADRAVEVACDLFMLAYDVFDTTTLKQVV